MQTWRLSLQNSFMLERDTRGNATFLLGLMVGGRRNECNSLLGDGLEFGRGGGQQRAPCPGPSWDETNLNTHPHTY